MKRTIVAILALSPVLALAQTNAPAQPRSTQISQVVVPAGLHAASSAADRSATPNVRVSTGVTPPHVSQSVKLVTLAGPQLHTAGAEQRVVLTLDVDSTGKPMNLAIAQSANAALDQDVLATVSKYRFTPGMLDGQPTTVPVRLEVIVPAGTTY